MNGTNNPNSWYNIINEEFEQKKELSNETLKRTVTLFNDSTVEPETQKEVLSLIIDIATKEDRIFRKGSKREVVEC